MSRRKRPSKRFGAPYQPVFDPLRMTEDFRVRSMHHEQPDTAVTSLHIHDALEIGYCHRGNGIFVVDDKVLPFAPGAATLIGEREFHLARSSPGGTSYWSFHHVDVAAVLGSIDGLDLVRVKRLGGSDFSNVFLPNDNPDICNLVKDIDDEAWADRSGRQAAIRGLLQVLLVRVLRIAPDPPDEATPDRTSAFERVAPALAAIAGHYAEEIELAELAEACELSITHFRRLFRAALGQSPANYIARFRVHKAAALLAGDSRTVVGIAFDCGFNSLSAFSRQFRETFGQSPRAFRALHHQSRRAAGEGARR